MDECLFCAIARKQVPSSIIFEDDLIVAFLDVRPIRPGHSQLIPREHIDYFEQLPEATASRIVHVGQRLSAIMKDLFKVPRVAFLFTGGDIQHAHAHLVPMHEKTDITSRVYIAETHLTFQSAPQVSSSELSTVATCLRQHMSAR
jgi:histidine triad (HIT) family protein